MTGLDYIVLLIVGVAAVGGAMRGLAQEILSLAGWFLAVFAIGLLHTPTTAYLEPYVGEGPSTAVLAFILLLLVPYFAMTLLARSVGSASRKSVLGPVDRVLGFGFGILKGFLIVVIGFSILVLGYDTIWGAQGRPNWITAARTYNLIDASSRSMVEIIAERRERLREEQVSGDEAVDG